MRTVVVGSSGGIGTAVCARLLADGHDVTRVDREDGIDATDPASIASALGDLDVVDHLVHLAGTVGSGGIEDHAVEDWRRILDDNLTSAFVCAQFVIPRLVPGSGTITFSSSVTARTGGTRYSGPAYAASKGAIATLTRHLASDLASDGIRVNAIAPGPVDTPMVQRLTAAERSEIERQIPLRRFASAEEIAGVIGFLLGEDARSITGAVLDVNGGMWMG